MKRPLVLIFITWIIVTTVSGQGTDKISVDKLKEDFQILRTTLKEIHPDLYRYNSKQAFDSKLDSLSKAIYSDLTPVEFYELIAPIVASIKNGHTAIKPPDTYFAQSSLLPFRLIEFNKNVFVRDDFYSSENKLRGLQVIEINGVSIKTIVERIMPYVSQDGFNDNARFKTAVEDDLAYYYNLVIGRPERFEIEFYDHESHRSLKETVVGISNSEFLARYSKTIQFPWTLTKVDSLETGFLKIGSFNNTVENNGRRVLFKKFLQESFEHIQEWKTKNLVIDLRNNGGGELKNAILLYSYIADSAFRFTKSIEIASLNPPTYSRYTDYEIALRFDNLDHRKITENGGRLYLTEHFSLADNEPRKENFEGNLLVMINGQTGSSAGCFAIQVKSNKRGLIVGEENRDNYTGYSAGVPVALTLPNSKLQTYIPLRKFVYVKGEDTGRGVIPDYVYTPIAKDYFNEVDAEFSYALNLLSKD